MDRNYLLKGDKSSVGGVVTEGIESTFNDDMPLAFIGAAVSCPACNTIGHVIAKGPRWPDDLMGKQAALDGDLCGCQCSPPPVMIAPNAGMVQSFEPGELAAMGYHPDGSLVAAVAGLVGLAGASLASNAPAGAGATDSSIQTSLGNAQPFEYQSSSPDGDGVLLAGAEGTPGNNQAQNKQFKAVVNALGLDKNQARLLHEEISGEGLGFHEIMERAQDMFGGSE